jgi:HEAT repeat protein
MRSFCANCFEIIDYADAICPRCNAQQNTAPGNLVLKLIRALKHPLADVRKRVVFVLGEKRAAEATNGLAEVADHDPDPYVAREAVIALSKIGGAPAVAALERAARHESFLVRKLAGGLQIAGADRRRAADRPVRDG